MSATSLTQSRKGDQIRAMFSAIAPTYDRLNHLLSLNRDLVWRRKAIQMLEPQPGEMILDLCGGTGDLAIECLRQQPRLKRVTVADFSFPMLQLAARKRKASVELSAADAMRLPYLDGSFDVVMVAFGVRNFEDLQQGIREAYRVLRPGGRLLVLEFFRPVSRLMQVTVRFFFRRAMPIIGRVVSGHAHAYSYLPQSMEAFVTRRGFEAMLQNERFAVRHSLDLDFGIASVVLAERRGNGETGRPFGYAPLDESRGRQGRRGNGDLGRAT